MTADEFWIEFLEATNRDKSIQYLESFHFDVHEKSANALLELVLTGKKKATASSVYAFKDSKVPEVGDFSIVTDWHGTPRCVIETTAITILPFSEVTYEICKREGEDDNLASWRKNHKKFFTAEGKQLDYEFSEDMPVVFEDFKVVYSG